MWFTTTCSFIIIIIISHHLLLAQDWSHRYGKPGHTDLITQLVTIPANNQLVSCSNDASVAIWSLLDGSQVHLFEGPANAFAVACQVVGDRLIAGFDYPGTIMAWNLTSYTLIWSTQVLDASIYFLRVTPAHVWVSTSKLEVVKYSMATGALVGAMLSPGRAPFWTFDVTANGSRLFVPNGLVVGSIMEFNHFPDASRVLTYTAPTSIEKIRILDVKGTARLFATTTSGFIYQFNITSRALERTYSLNHLQSPRGNGAIQVQVMPIMTWDAQDLLIIGDTLYATILDRVESWNVADPNSNRTTALIGSARLFQMAHLNHHDQHGDQLMIADIHSNIWVYANVTSAIPSIKFSIESGDMIQKHFMYTLPGQAPQIIYVTSTYRVVMLDTASNSVLGELSAPNGTIPMDIAIWESKLYTAYLINSVTEHHLIPPGWMSPVRTFESYDSVRNTYSTMMVYAYQDYLFACGAYSFQIFQFNLTTGDLVHSFSGHIAEVKTMRVIDTRLISGSADYTVRVWSLTSGALIQTLYVGYGVPALAIIDHSLFVAGWSGLIDMYDLNTYTFVRTVTEMDYSVNALLEYGHHLFSGSDDGAVRMWRVESEASVVLVKRFQGHRLAIVSLDMLDGFLYSGSIDGTIRRWDFSSFITLPPQPDPTSTTTSFSTPRTSSRVVRRTTIQEDDDVESQNEALSDSNASAIAIGVSVSMVFAAVGAATAYLRHQKRRERISTLSYTTSKPKKSSRSTQSRSKIVSSSNTTTTRTSMDPSARSQSSSRSHSAHVTHVTTVVDRTAIDKVTTHELSIPAFLQVKWGLDIRQDAFLAKGGGGEVFFATALNNSLLQRSQGQPLVLKRVADTFISLSERSRAGFYQELALMWKYRDHPNFVKVYAYAMEPTCTVMKFYALGDLDDFIAGHGSASRYYRYTKFMLIDLFRQLCNGIAYMHISGIAHCDVKPANALLDINRQTGQLILAISDFGIARVITDASLGVSAFVVSEVRGASVAYAAPDVFFRFRSRRDERSADIWKAGDTYALSMTLLDMMMRKTPWS